MSDNDLLDFVSRVSGDTHLAVEENLGDGFVRLRTAEAERRQAKHDIRCIEDIVIEMLRNARDAHARNIFLATTKEGSARTLVFIDDGDGIPENMHEAIFEPRVTSKLETMVMDTWGVHGRGMALYSIKSNCTTARVAKSSSEMGAAISVTANIAELTERTDQSTLPVLERDDVGSLHVSSGPHNIVRTVVEFALEEKDRVDVYLGSPAEIVAALIEQGRKRLSDAELLFCDDVDSLPVYTIPAQASDAKELVEICRSLDLSLSERTAHRIFAGQIKPASCPLDQLTARHHKSSAPATADIYSDSRGLKISSDDLNQFSRDLERVFQDLSERYYLELADEPKIRVGKDAITVKFLIEKNL